MDKLDLTFIHADKVGSRKGLACLANGFVKNIPLLYFWWNYSIFFMSSKIYKTSFLLHQIDRQSSKMRRLTTKQPKEFIKYAMEQPSISHEILEKNISRIYNALVAFMESSDSDAHSKNANAYSNSSLFCRWSFEMNSVANECNKKIF